jgi:hypothetical protein
MSQSTLNMLVLIALRLIHNLQRVLIQGVFGYLLLLVNDFKLLSCMYISSL